MRRAYRGRMDELLSIAGRSHAVLPLDVLAGLALLSVAPFVLVLSTAFVRIVVVLSLVRSAIGAASLPPKAASPHRRWKARITLAMSCGSLWPWQALQVGPLYTSPPK